MNDSDVRHGTLAVTHSERGRAPAPGVEDVVVPVHLSSIYSVPSADPDADLETLDPDTDEYFHSRLSNPMRNALGRRLAALEETGYVLVFASGTAVIAATMTVVVRPDDHVVAFEDLCNRTKTMFTRLLIDRLNVDVPFVDVTDPENVAAVMREEMALVWMETPTNLLMHLCGIEAIAAIADEGDAVFGVGNTFLSPRFQASLSPGVDVVVHSAMKYLNDHSDSIDSAIVTDREDVLEELMFLQCVGMGSMLSPFDSYLTLQGIRALLLRMRQHETNVIEIVEFLDSHEMVTRVLYPGLESHPQYDLAACQQSGFGGVLSFRFDIGLDGTAEFLGTFREFLPAVSLDGVESPIEHSAAMTHLPFLQTERDALGISDSLLWLPVGVEYVDDPCSDLVLALSVLRGIRGSHSRISFPRILSRGV